MPRAAATQMDAAVVRPWTSPPSRRIAPAPRNPTPVTIWAPMRGRSIPGPERGMSPRPVNMHAPTEISVIVLSPAGCPRYSRSTPSARPRTSETSRRIPKSSSLPCSGSCSASAGTAAGLVLRPGLVLRAGLVRELRQVEAVHEVAKDSQALLVHRGLNLVLVTGVLVRLGDDAGGLHHLGCHEDRALDSHRQGDRVRRSRVEVQVATILFDVETRVEDLVREARDDDSLDADPEVAERRGHQVVGEGATQRVARDLGRDRLRLEGPDPDGEVPVGLLLFEDHQVLSGRHVYPNAVDGDLDEVFHPRFHYTFRTS